MCCVETAAKKLSADRAMAKAQIIEVKKHQKGLCATLGREVDFDEALDDWLEHHATEWRQRWQQEYLSHQREEILRHKWIESEKAHRDLGSEAVFDWIARYAAQWRAWYEQELEKRLQTEKSS